MSSATLRIAGAALALAAAALLLVVVIPWKEPSLPRPAPVNAALANPVTASAPRAAPLASPDEVLRLFTGRAPAPAPQAAAPVAAPQDAAWLQYLGRSQSAAGVVSVFLKDTRSGKLITASPGNTPEGWSIVQEKDGVVIVKNGDTLYSVKTR